MLEGEDKRRKLHPLSSPRQFACCYRNIADRGPASNEIVTVMFLRSHVERCEFREFIAAFDIERMTPEALRSCMGQLLFAVDGYHTDSRELATIQEVRRFHRALHEQWPYWFFFSAMESMPHMVFCCLDTLVQASRDATPAVSSYLVTGDQVHEVVFSALVAMNRPWDKAGLSEEALKQRWRLIYTRFGLTLPPSL